MRPACVIPCLHALWAFFALAAFCCAAHAQESEPPSNEGTPASQKTSDTESDSADAKAEAAVEKAIAKKDAISKPWESAIDRATAGPDIYLLPGGENGKLRQVLGFPYEEFQRAWQQQGKIRPATPPLYTIDNLDISGTAEGSLAKFDIKIDIMPRGKNGVGVPLQLRNLIVQNWELEGKTDEEFLDFDVSKRSFVLWLKSEPGKSRRLTLQGLLKLSRGSSSPGLEINLPHAAKSQFVFQVPESEAQFEASPGIDLTTQPSETGGTEVRLKGQTSPLRLKWGAVDERKLTDDAVVEAIGDVVIHVDRYRAHYDATFNIDSHGKPLDRLRVLLPEGAKLTKESLTGDYRIVDHVEEDGIVVIQRLESSSDPWQLHLIAEQQRDAKEATLDESQCIVSGFDVLGAFRQSGTVRLSLDDQLQAFFDLDRDIEQVPINNDQQGAAEQAVAAQFEYSRLPWKLDVHTVARKQRVSVTPKYILSIKQNQAELHFNFDYQFTGAYTPSVWIKMHGWKITDDPIESGDAVNLDRIESKQQGLLVLPISNPKAERVPISLVARREIKQGHIELPLPEPLHAFVLPGRLTVESEPSLRVTRSVTGTRGISIAPATSLAGSPPNGQPDSPTPKNRNGDKETLELRTFLADAVLGADIAQREREVLVDVDTTINIDLEKITVSQQLQYEVKYQPITQLELQIPEQLWENNTLQVRLDGEEVPIGLGIFSEEMPVDQDDRSEADLPDASADSKGLPAVVKIRQLIVSLPRPMQSNFLLEIQYHEDASHDLNTAALTPTTLPLIAPENQIRSNALSAQTAKTIRVTLNPTADRGPWNAVLGPSDQESSSLRLRGTGKPTTVPLLMQLESKDDAERATLDSTWLQTWIVDKRQQDRAVFRFRTKQPTVIAQLPSDLLDPEVEVLLDGIPTEFKRSSSNRFTIPIPNHEAFDSHTLELRYQRQIELSSWGNLETKMPRLDSREMVGPVFWQLILPRGWYVASSPEQFSGEYWIGWQDYLWGRQPTYYQPDLERRTGATSAPPPSSPNQYLYRGFEIPRNVNVLVVGQARLVFIATLIAFGIGMLVIYTPLVRISLFWLVLALTLAGLVVVSPALTMLAVQAIFWAGLMTLAAAVLRQLFVGTSRPFVVIDADLESASTAVTASWEPEPESVQLVDESHATSLHSGGTAS